MLRKAASDGARSRHRAVPAGAQVRIHVLPGSLRATASGWPGHINHSLLSLIMRGPFYYMVLFGLCCSGHPPSSGTARSLQRTFESAGWASGRPVRVGRPSASRSSCAVLHAISVPWPRLALSGFRLQIAHRCPQCSLRRVRARCLLAFGGLGGTVLSTSRTRLRATLLSVRVLSPEVTLPVGRVRPFLAWAVRQGAPRGQSPFHISSVHRAPSVVDSRARTSVAGPAVCGVPL